MKFFAALLVVFFAHASYAQLKSPFIKFGKITADEIQKKVYNVDTSANAVVLSDIGDASLGGNSKGWFSVTFTRHCVVHILNKNGYNEANVQIYLYSKGSHEEKLEKIQAVTYNLESGKVVETNLEKANIFKEKIDENRTAIKFTMPAIKEGSIIEFQYTVLSDYFDQIDAWAFQGTSPVLWSEYNLSVPEFFSYAFLTHGYQPLFIQDKKTREDRFTIIESRGAGPSEYITLNAKVSDYRWVMKDVPELKEESFTSSLKNHISRIEFQLASQNYPLVSHDYRNSWPTLTRELLESDNFGHALNNNNGWLSDEVNPLIKGSNSEVEKARNIYAFVRDNYSCTGHNTLYATQSLKNVMKTKKGNVAEINLLLTAMLRHAGLVAEPLIMSTKDNGYPLNVYPMLSNYNYVVTEFVSGDQTYYLDASHSRLGFGKMLPQCYNGGGRVINEEARQVEFSADSIKEGKVSSVYIINDDKGKWTGVMKKTLGYFESCSLRDEVKEKGEEEFFKKIQKEYGNDVKISEPRIDSLKDLENPVYIKYNMELNAGNEDVLYINPMFSEGYRKNPFKSTERLYPVEMPYASDETYLVSMEVPKGYTVDELPKQIVAKLDDNGSATFEYRITQSDNIISLRSRIKFIRTLFLPDEYINLREFFNLVVSKQNQQIVFKRQK